MLNVGSWKLQSQQNIGLKPVMIADMLCHDTLSLTSLVFTHRSCGGILRGFWRDFEGMVPGNKQEKIHAESQDKLHHVEGNYFNQKGLS